MILGNSASKTDGKAVTVLIVGKLQAHFRRNVEVQLVYNKLLKLV